MEQLTRLAALASNADQERLPEIFREAVKSAQSADQPMAWYDFSQHEKTG
jgi:hypothetical protein